MKTTLLTLMLAFFALAKGQIKFPFDALERFPPNAELAIAIIDGSELTYLGFKKSSTGVDSVVNKSSVFEIGSITKVFTSMMLAQLVVEGKVKTDEAFNRYWKVKLKGKPKITMQQLANHTSGLPRLPGNILQSMAKDPGNPYLNYSNNELLDYLKNDLQLAPDPKQVAYSNLGAGLLGLTMANLERCTYEELLQKRILKPLGMTASTSERSLVKGKLVDALNAKGESRSHWDFGIMAGAGGIFSSMEDMVRFAQAAMDTTQRYNQLMQTPTAQAGEGMQVGLGWFLIGNSTQPIVWHNGATGGFRSSMAIEPKNKKAILILSNLSSEHPEEGKIDELCFTLFKQLTSER